MAKEPGVLAGVCVVPRVFRAIDRRVQVVLRMRDGTAVAPGDVVADVVGPASAVLAGERTALNFVQRMSGVATSSARYADAASFCGMACRVLDTRKTLPGWRLLDKYAVRVGGMRNHRKSLADMAMVKDNHADAAGGIAAAVRCVRSVHPMLPVEVEVRNETELRQALAVCPSLDRVMLDNMTLDAMRAAVAVRDAVNRDVSLEASGGVTLGTVTGIAETGVDFVSVGATTHSVTALDFNMKVVTIPGGADGVSTPEKLQKLLDSRQVAELAAATTAITGCSSNAIVLAGHGQRAEVAMLSESHRCLGTSELLLRAAKIRKSETVICCTSWNVATIIAAIVPDGTAVHVPILSAAIPGPMASVEDADEMLKAAGSGAVPVVALCGASDELVAWAGRHGGAACTNSTAADAIKWALTRGTRCVFLPDINLCETAVVQCGMNPAEQMLRWSPLSPRPTNEAIEKSKVIAWAGASTILARLGAADVADARKALPGARVLVHPRCPREVRRAADVVAASGKMYEIVESAPVGTVFAIGDDRRNVAALALRATAIGKTVHALGPACRCVQSAEAAAVTLSIIARCLSTSAASSSPIATINATNCPLVPDIRAALKPILNIVC